MVSWWVQYWPRAEGLTSIMAQGITWIMVAFVPQRLFESNLNNGPSQGHSNLVMLKITTACTIAALLISLFFPLKCYEASFKRAQSVNENCLTIPHLRYGDVHVCDFEPRYPKNQLAYEGQYWLVLLEISCSFI